MTLFSGDKNARIQYMNDLAMQAALDDRSLQAMKLVARTGQTVAQLSDLRSIDEKFADTEFLKSRVRTDLLTITDAVNANSIMGSLSPAELTYVAQHFDELAKEIRPKYKMGILKAQFDQFLASYMASDAAATVTGRPVSAADLAAAAANAPTRAQMNRLGLAAERTQETLERNGAREPRRGEHAPRRKKADVLADAEALGLETHFASKRGSEFQGRAIPVPTLEFAIDEERARRKTIEEYPAAARNLAFSPLARSHTQLQSPRTAPATMAVHEEPRSGEGVRFRMTGRGLNRVPLGRYTIDARSLGDNVVKIKSQRGAAVARYPTEKVSAKIGSLLRKLVSGGSLEFDDLQDLDDGEKRYLHKVAVGCDLTGTCPISAPKNDDVQVEQDLFTKLRGEICAGNTNVDLIKDFKKLLFKMKTEGSLPGSQVNRVLLDLLSLGH